MQDKAGKQIGQRASLQIPGSSTHRTRSDPRSYYTAPLVAYPLAQQPVPLDLVPLLFEPKEEEPFEPVALLVEEQD